ncbi:MAG TPA: AAA family ATPase [Gemmatimonadaceae bacterium]
MIHLLTLGQCAIQVGRSRLAPDAERLFAAALYLVVEHGRPIGRGELTALLWPDAEEARAQHSLRQALYKLKSLGFRFATEHAAIMLAPKDVELDYGIFLKEQRPSSLEELSECIAGPCLPGYAPRISSQFNEWLDRLRDVVHSALRRALVAGIVAKRARADWGAVEALSRKCLSLDPLNEEATLAVAEAAAMHGSKAYALSVIDRYLKEIGPEAREIRLPATALRRRIANTGREAPVPLGQGPFVGRAPEMAMLNDALSLGIAGHGSAFLLWGEPGIGKSRLTTEFLKGAGLLHVQVARVGCQSHDERRSLSAFVDLVPRLLELRGAIGCSPDSMKYLKRLTDHDPTMTTPSPDAREAELLFSNIRRSLFDLIDAIAAEAALIVVVEDVHWLDPMSWEVMRDLVSWLATRRVLLILTSRERHVDAPQRARVITSLRRTQIGPLADPAGRELLNAMLVHRTVAAEFREWCLQTSAGNPYYMSELAAHAAAEGEVYQVPVSLTALIAERLTRLQPVSRRVLQACAILGKMSTLERVEAVLAQTRVDLLDSLDDLERQGLIDSDGARLVAKHELLAQAAVGELSKSARQLLHRHAAAVLQAEGERTQESALLWECAEHWNAAGETERAVGLLRTCAQHSLEMGVPGDAAKLLERALQFPLTLEDALSVMEDRLVALQFAGQWALVLPASESLIQSYGTSARNGHHTSAELVLIEAQWRNGAPVVDLFERVATCTQCCDASAPHRVRAATLALMFADNLCWSERAIKIFAAVRHCLDAPDVDDAARYYLLLVYHCSFGDHAEAVKMADALICCERAHGNPARLTRALRQCAHAFHVAGSTKEGLLAAEEAFRIAVRHELRGDAVAAAHRLTDIYLHLDDLETADRWQQEAVTQRPADGGGLGDLITESIGAELFIRTGRYNDAQASIERMVAANTRCGAPINGTTRSTSCLLSLQVALRLFSGGKAPTDIELKQLLELYGELRKHDGYDWFVYVLCRALEARGMNAQAQEILCEYLSHYRRERSTPSPVLMTLRATYLGQQDEHQAMDSCTDAKIGWRAPI